MSCQRPIDAAVLGDYWLSALAESEEEAVELHLLECGDCAGRLREVMSLAEGIGSLAREGSLRMVVSESYLERIARDGLRIREYTVEAGGRIECTVTAEDNLLIARLSTNLAGAKRVDLCLCDGHGIERMRLPDIPVRSGAGEVVYQESISFAKALPTDKLIVRMVALEDEGQERLLGEYAFSHTRSLPGPGGSIGDGMCSVTD